MATEILRPNANGDENALTTLHPGGGESAYQNVDEVEADDDNTYVTGTDEDDIEFLETYEVSAPSGTGTINKITVYARVKGYGEDTTISAMTMVKAATFTGAGAVELEEATWTTISHEYGTNPTTEQAWTWEDIAALQIGVFFEGTFVEEALEAYLTQIYVEIDYTEATPDITPPVITLLGEATVNLTVGDSYEDAGATALDETDGDITEDIVVGGDEVDTNTPGIYIITYNVEDAASNAADEITRTVIVSKKKIKKNPFKITFM